MGSYIVRRVFAAAGSLLLLSIVIFVLLRALPGGSAEAVLGENARPAAVDALNKEFGFDKPLIVQYGTWLASVARLDLGHSLFRGGQPVSTIIKRGIVPSVEIAVLTILVTVAIAIPVGVLGAVKHNTVLDHVPRLLVIVILAVPEFWLGSIVLITCSTQFHWTPPLIYRDLWSNPRDNLEQMALPALILGLIYSAMVARLTRSSMLDVLTADYVRTARAKGLREWTVIWRHCFRQSLLPVVTFLGIQFGRLLGGVVILEVLFSVPGLGQRLLVAITQRDFPVVQGIVLIMGVVFVVVNLVIDVSYGLLDPRVRGRT